MFSFLEQYLNLFITVVIDQKLTLWALWLDLDLDQISTGDQQLSLGWAHTDKRKVGATVTSDILRFCFFPGKTKVSETSRQGQKALEVPALLEIEP